MGHRQFFASSAVVDENAVFAGDVMGAEILQRYWRRSWAVDAETGTVAAGPVLVGTIERSRHPRSCVVFLAGATQKSFRCLCAMMQC